MYNLSKKTSLFHRNIKNLLFNFLLSFIETIIFHHVSLRNIHGIVPYFRCLYPRVNAYRTTRVTVYISLCRYTVRYFTSGSVRSKQSRVLSLFGV